MPARPSATRKQTIEITSAALSGVARVAACSVGGTPCDPGAGDAAGLRNAEPPGDPGVLPLWEPGELPTGGAWPGDWKTGWPPECAPAGVPGRDPEGGHDPPDGAPAPLPEGGAHGERGGGIGAAGAGAADAPMEG